ncbi:MULTISPECIES: PatA/PatG family cyanobactin maturation protease [unclassified Microcoleus]|uniref:PatA/PatG family cyanobactin maturation protease n=1 Tax=unclassified Microcoleus TaxID=2642155 RepID=UPI001D625BC6|nr:MULTISPECIES: PatA/PatG family cyanobactin maturation protease [unclassified Microcoleus]MCC3506888.1 PatA/PatG family cyanobactin maturation protease [Microcoleus sp. PH2017_19_SFW_U_A]TAG86552.1 MAG: PatA/PatG family cyanobactin maturation protease [Oscillatoriales cyanobacterium]MCC3525535.1 PatA/PatG family cyanobactin maturation protease [Microcoleus sp. PH2017_20_SFW_D_A]MCC3556393.1 PatA/PatG family cyanobactin maturation protease [Microcoleus sp. PH2017_35_SFW_U_B]MCC3568047.1 PatA/
MPDLIDNSQDLQQIRDFYNLVGQSPTNQGCLLRVTSSDADPFHGTTLYLAAQAGIKPGNYVLDAGCGTGGPSIVIAQSIEDVTIEGINLSEEQVNIGQKLVQEAGLSDRICLQVADFHDLPFDSGIFDVVVFFETIGFSDELRRVLAEAYRVLRRQGTLYIKDLFRQEHPLSEQEQQKLAKFKQAQFHNVPRISEVSEAIELAGFQDIKVRDLSDVLISAPLADFPAFCGDIKAQKPFIVPITTRNISGSSSESPAMPNHDSTPVTPSQSAGTVTASVPSNLVYALGTLGYDFGTEARRDTFKQLMPAYEIEGTAVPANPYDARQMVDYLEQNPSEGKALIWTLNLELTPVYAIEPKGPFGADVYETLQLMLAGQVLAEDSEDFIERVSIPGRLSDRTVELFSGQIVPVITVQNTRGMYGWRVNSLIASALETVRDSDSDTSSEAIGRSLTSFLHRIYFDLRNLGQTAHDRALNFAATNAFQAASTFAEAVARGMELDSIEVEKSPFCRLDSDCWDVKLKFFDPENSSRAKKVFRFTIDVRDAMPVTLGEVRSWSVPS